MPRDPLSRVRPRRVSDCEPSAISENVGNRYVRATCTWSNAFSRSSCAIRIARLLASAALMASSSVSALVVDGAASGVCAETGAAEHVARRSKANKKFNAQVEEPSREFTRIISTSRDIPVLRGKRLQISLRSQRGAAPILAQDMTAMPHTVSEAACGDKSRANQPGCIGRFLQVAAGVS